MNRISSCGTTHQANLGRARSYNEFAGTLKAREKDNLMCDRVEKDREWISGQMADVDEAAAPALIWLRTIRPVSCWMVPWHGASKGIWQSEFGTRSTAITFPPVPE